MTAKVFLKSQVCFKKKKKTFYQQHFQLEISAALVFKILFRNMGDASHPEESNNWVTYGKRFEMELSSSEAKGNADPACRNEEITVRQR